MKAGHVRQGPPTLEDEYSVLETFQNKDGSPQEVRDSESLGFGGKKTKTTTKQKQKGN